MIGDLEIVTVGLNHRTAPVELRERFAVPSESLPSTFTELRENALSRESVILSTCNRVEFYALVEKRDRGQGLINWMAETRGMRSRTLEKHLYRFEGEAAVQHLFRVAASLDSMVLGEPQILGQLKTAFMTAMEHRAVGQTLQRTMQRALSVAKRVRTETRIGREPISMGRAGVDLARQVFGSLDGRVAMMIGAGEMGRLVARSLLAEGASELIVANRTYRRAAELAAEFSGTAVHLDQLERYLEQVDIVLTSTGARHHLLNRAMMSKVMRARRYKPLFCVDLSVPRNVAPDVNELDGAYVFNVDDLSEVARQGMARRQAEAQRAEQIIDAEAARCYRQLEALSADPVIGAITRRAERLRRLEMERSRAVMADLDPAQREVIEAMTRSMFKRFLHDTIQTARDLGERGDEDGLELLRRALGSEEGEGPGGET